MENRLEELKEMQETVEGLQAHVHELDTAVTTQLVEKQKAIHH